MLAEGERAENRGAASQVFLDMLPGFELPGNKVIASNFLFLASGLL